MKRSKLIIGALLAIGLIFGGCSGNTENEDIGIVIDSHIIGLRYVSRSPLGTIKEGVTNSKGEYIYFKNGTTKFYVGAIEIGETSPEKLVVISTISNDSIQQNNIARFLQTIDDDNNPENGIQITSDVDTNAKNITNFKFDENFETLFEVYKDELFSGNTSGKSLVSSEQAEEHASKSLRLTAIKEFDLYKAIANEKNYRSISEYYNADILENDQRKRIYLWLWEKVLAKEMDIANDLATQDFDIDKVEEQRDKYKKYLDYAESVTSIATLGKSTYDNLSKVGTRTFAYEITEMTSLAVGGCSAIVKLYDANSMDEIVLDDDNLCKNMLKVINPVGDSQSRLAVVNPVISAFFTDALPVIMRLQKMNMLKTNAISRIAKYNVKKPDLISLGLSIAQIVNDSNGAYKASNINKELTTRLVAKEWLSIWFRSAGNQQNINKQINNNDIDLTSRKSQIEAIALNWGTSDAFCDAYKFFNPFVDCTGIENVNYDYDRVDSIIGEYLAKSNALYKNIVDLTGPISNEEAKIGTIEIDWEEEEGFIEESAPVCINPQDTYFSIPSQSATLYTSNTSRNITTDPEGRIYILYANPNGIYVAKSETNGLTFNEPVKINNSSAEAEISVSSNGYIYVAWSSPDGIKTSVSGDYGETFSTPSIVSSNTPASIHIETDNSKMYMIARNGIDFLYSDNNGQTFTNIDLAEGEVFSDVRVDHRTGEVFVQTDDPALQIFNSTDYGKTFTYHDLRSEMIYYSTMALTSSDNGRYMFISGNGSNGYRVNLDGNYAIEPFTFGNNTTNQARTLFSDKYGNFIDGYTNNGSLYFSVSTDYAESFSQTIKVDDSADNMSISVDSYCNKVNSIYVKDNNVIVKTFANTGIKN